MLIATILSVSYLYKPYPQKFNYEGDDCKLYFVHIPLSVPAELSALCRSQQQEAKAKQEARSPCHRKNFA
jgi:hypothetical protein